MGPVVLKTISLWICRKGLSLNNNALTAGLHSLRKHRRCGFLTDITFQKDLLVII